MDKKPVKKKAFHRNAEETDIYVVRKHRLNIYIRRIKKLFEKNIHHVQLHGMGASVLNTIKIALYIKEYYADIDLDIQTSSEPTLVEKDEFEDEVKMRSSIHIKIKKNI